MKKKTCKRFNFFSFVVSGGDSFSSEHCFFIWFKLLQRLPQLCLPECFPDCISEQSKRKTIRFLNSCRTWTESCLLIGPYLQYVVFSYLFSIVTVAATSTKLFRLLADGVLIKATEWILNRNWTNWKFICISFLSLHCVCVIYKGVYV